MAKTVSAKKPKTRIDASFLILVLVLLTFGLVMLFSASYAYAYQYYNNSFYFIIRQAGFAAVGVALMIAISFMDYHILKRLSYIIFLASAVLLVVVLFLPKVKGVRRWINLGFATFQPSEIMKFAIVVLFAYLIEKNYLKMKTFKYGVLPFIATLLVVAGLMILEPHVSGTVLIMGIGFIMMFVGGTKYKWFVGALTAVAAGVVGFISIKGIGYVADRLKGWLDPFWDPLNTTFQTSQSLIAIGSGGLLGLGLGNSRQKFLYLPEPQNDFIFSIICEELGFIGAMAVILLFVFFIYRGFVIASKAPDKFGCMLAVGLTVQVGLQVLLNIAVVTNTIPNTGISLPFFSYGGTALLMQLCQMGIILNISRQGSLTTS